jgi:serine/threonine protein kinase
MPNDSIEAMSSDAIRLPPVESPASSNVPAGLAGNPQYQVVREPGRGGMGVVYLARNLLMDRLEVIKVSNRSLLEPTGASSRCLREIRAEQAFCNPRSSPHALCPFPQQTR